MLSTMKSTEERLTKHMEEMLASILTQFQQFRAACPKETSPSPSPLANPPEQQLTKTTAPPKTNPSTHPLPKPTAPPKIDPAVQSLPKTTAPPPYNDPQPTSTQKKTQQPIPTAA